MKLIDLLPEYYARNITMQTLQEILSTETEKLDEKLSNVLVECFAATAKELLPRYEGTFGLNIDISKSDMFRRERIIAKITGVGTTTKEMIENASRSYSNGAVEVVEDATGYKFLVRFVGTTGIPGNMPDLKMTIEEIKPAHLLVEYEYIYNTWAVVGRLTWIQAASHTWEEIRTARL